MPTDLSPGQASRILVVDAGETVAAELRMRFPEAAGTLRHVRAGMAALERLRKCDLVVMDLDLPDVEGLDLLVDIRARSELPVIVMAAGPGGDAEIKCLDCGADEYLAKPANIDVLVARIRAVLRRMPPVSEGLAESAQDFDIGEVEFAGFRFDTAGLTLWAPSGDPVPLTAKEAKLLVYFVKSPKRTLGREAIRRHLNGKGDGFNERLVDGLVNKLRRKLRHHLPAPDLVRSDRNEGYWFTATVERTDGGSRSR